jgi:hypothetical protein
VRVPQGKMLAPGLYHRVGTGPPPSSPPLDDMYHYWYHLGEAHAIRQMLGHQNLPQFVGNMSNAVYRPERAYGIPKSGILAVRANGILELRHGCRLVSVRYLDDDGK